MAVVFESLFAVCVRCPAVYYLGKKDQHDDFAVLYDIDLWLDNITVHEISLVSACGTAVVSVPRILCLRIC